MAMKKRICAGLAAGMLLILILDGQTALESACDAAVLCIKTVIPSLFPFLFLCAMITSSLWAEPLQWLHGLAGPLGIPKGGESLLISAFLGGYPAGAQTVSTCFQEGLLSRQQAEHLLPLCNNAGPAFLFGMAALQFSQPRMAAALWIIQILSVYALGSTAPSSEDVPVYMTRKPFSLSGAMDRTARTMAIICGWILLFQILIRFLRRWFLWFFPIEVQICITGLLELSSGCCQLQEIGSEALRFLICTVMLTFGGLCVTMQTASVIGDLSIGAYLRSKLIQSTVALLLSVFYLYWGWAALAGAAVVILVSPAIKKNNCRFSESSGV